MALQVKRPVQLAWSRIEETMNDGFRPPARALLTASLGQGNIITGWRARIAAPSTVSEVSGRLHGGKPGAAGYKMHVRVDHTGDKHAAGY